MNLVRGYETIHVVQFDDSFVKKLQDQCDAIVRLDKRVNVRL
jgi:hypothetical protein